MSQTDIISFTTCSDPDISIRFGFSPSYNLWSLHQKGYVGELVKYVSFIYTEVRLGDRRHTYSLIHSLSDHNSVVNSPETLLVPLFTTVGFGLYVYLPTEDQKVPLFSQY